MSDIMKVKILKGGVIKITTDQIGPENHVIADEFVRFIARKLGGETISERRTDAVHESHSHEHDHEHN